MGATIARVDYRGRDIATTTLCLLLARVLVFLLVFVLMSVFVHLFVFVLVLVFVFVFVCVVVLMFGFVLIYSQLANILSTLCVLERGILRCPSLLIESTS